MSPPIEFRFDELDSAWSRVVSTLNASRHHNQEKSKVQADLAVTLLTGFLGSGKTTILRHALQHPEGLKIAAVVNDVGEIEVDAHLVAAETSNSLSLANGCVCCVLADDLSDQLEMLARSGDYDAVIIEASGVADPISVAQTIHGTNGCHLDGIVAVADSRSLEEQLGNHHTASLLHRQLQAAHLVVLSKIDLVNEDTRQATHDLVAEAAPGSRILSAESGQIDVKVLCGASDRGVSLTSSENFSNFNFVSTVINPAGPWDPIQLGNVLEQPDHQLLRAKGWFDDQHGSRYHLEVVGRRWSIEESSGGPFQALVLIGLDQIDVDTAAAALDRITKS
ncbi:MAG: GTP-binding protein [Actinomycetota bacterium]|nr:GTP-binding protein [Actinomycetota bacterium]